MIERAVNAVIRPPRMDYDDLDIPLVLEADDDRTFVRYPATFRNQRGETLVGSIYHAIDHPPFNGGPCVVYLHGNASSQLEGQFLVPNLCPLGVFVFCFDFAGCGCSGGKYVSLGWFEREDTEFLLDILHRTFHLGPFVLWGRSMGAATALLVKSPLLVGRVIDSAFTSVRDMCSAVAVSMKLPKVFVPAAMWFLKKKVLSAAKFNFDEVAPINVDNEGTEVPAVFGHAEKDQFIPFEQCQRLYEHYQCGNKYLMVLPGGHNSKRKIEWIQLGVFFCLEQFKINADGVKISECRRLQESTFHFTSFEAMVGKATEGAVTGEEIDALMKDEVKVEKIMEEVEHPKHRHRRHRHHKAGEDGAGDGEKRRRHRRHRREKNEGGEQKVDSEPTDSAPATSDEPYYSAATSQDIFDLTELNQEGEEAGERVPLERGDKAGSENPDNGSCLTRSEGLLERDSPHEEEHASGGDEVAIADLVQETESNDKEREMALNEEKQEPVSDDNKREVQENEKQESELNEKKQESVSDDDKREAQQEKKQELELNQEKQEGEEQETGLNEKECETEQDENQEMVKADEANNANQEQADSVEVTENSPDVGVNGEGEAGSAQDTPVPQGEDDAQSAE